MEKLSKPHHGHYFPMSLRPKLWLSLFFGKDNERKDNKKGNESLSTTAMNSRYLSSILIVLIKFRGGPTYQNSCSFPADTRSGPMYNFVMFCKNLAKIKYPPYCKFVSEFKNTSLTAEELKEGDFLLEEDKNLPKFNKMLITYPLFKATSVWDNIVRLKGGT